MRSVLKKCTTVLLSLLLAVSIIPAGAVHAAEEITERYEATYINPLYEPYFTEEDAAELEALQQRRDPQMRYASAYAETADEAAEQLRAGLRSHSDNFFVYVRVPASAMSSGTPEFYDNFTDYIWQKATEVSTDGLAGDYLRWNYQATHFSAEAAASNVNYVWINIKYSVTYGTTQEQELQMKSAADAVIDSLGFTDQTSAYDKIAAIYDYVTANVRYTTGANVYNNLYHTAYSAIVLKDTVCQGYSTLLYYMLWSCGIPNRIVVSEDHAWNTVWLRGQWYNLDATWDRGTDAANHKFFLKGRSTGFYDDPQHTPDTNESFHNLYPYLVNQTTADDYGAKRTEDTGHCAIHTAADTTYTTDSGEICSWCKDCGQSVTFPLWQAETTLQLNREKYVLGETVTETASCDGADQFQYAIYSASLEDGTYQTGDLLGSYGPAEDTSVTYDPEAEGSYKAAVWAFKGRWGYGYDEVYFDAAPPVVVTEGDWSYYIMNDVATVTAFSSDIGLVIVPDTLGGYPVAAIDPGAFQDNTTMTYLAIPESVKTIGESAFSGCAGLDSVFYEGTSEQWQALAVSGDGNDPFFDAKGHYVYGGYSTTIIAWEDILSGGEPTSLVLSYCQPGQAAAAYGASYDADGRFLGIVSQELAPGKFNTLWFPNEGAVSMKVFLLDSNAAPLCESQEVLKR